ncbi:MULTISPECIES: Hsp20/alpha crystallin family protein [Nitrosomonas]|uniref:HSP20 family protein n=1 Tax=Nitrosomonas communis TaxID=44574 RepID=A0A0F7KFF4_9PROT|nr:MULTISPECIES: Hsp20/alpha crystallin family protein [Nitrosomonas]AKH37512.1 heat-shock protein [Nitrosomonas communis]TYP92347.1 HSP20 family protein [Nitrosomonas communis]UVS62762.1 Hsp20/alpha crystallin family protein [Nitrosomonas sp. PLL12]
MLESLKEAGKSIGRELGRAWENLSDGWRELLTRSGEALTHFGRNKDDKNEVTTESESQLPVFPRWGLLAGEVEETDKEIVVRVEAPGIEKEDWQITIDGNKLYLSGEKRFERVTHDSTYHIMERAYGSFQRSIPLPHNVDIDRAEANYKNGVLTIHLPKIGDYKSRTVRLS